MRIMRFAGTSIGKFKSYDGATHDAAKAVAKAAGASDGEGVILAFQKLQAACYNCHLAFRKPLVEHFTRRAEKTRTGLPFLQWTGFPFGVKANRKTYRE
jgi:hypothetical protein